MRIKFDFEINPARTTSILAIGALVLYVCGGEITDILTDKDTIVAVHGTLIAGFIAIIAAQMTVKAMNTQMAHERFLRDLDNYERVAAKTRAIAQEIEDFLCQVESKLRYFEFGQVSRGVWVVSPGVKDIDIQIPNLITKPDFIIDLPRNDAVSIRNIRIILDSLLEKEPVGEWSKDRNHLYYDPQDVKSYVSSQRFNLGPCHEILHCLTCYRPAPVESAYR